MDAIGATRSIHYASDVTLASSPLMERCEDQIWSRKTETKMSSLAAKPKRMLRLGFVPLTDCAPLVLAQELGLFKKYGLNVALSRELGWATIRDKIIHGELDAAHAVAGMPIAATLGLGSIPCECLTGLVLNLNGNAITVAQQLWQNNIRDAATLRAEITRQRGRKVFTFGIVAAFSSHHFLLRNWLKSAGIEPNEVRIVVVPPPQMVANLKAGHLDGFCVGEPWNSVAVRSGEGVVLGVSAELDPLHPEKVLMVRREFAQQQEAQHLALIAALLEACAFCDQPVNHDHVSQVLARPEWVNVPAEVLRCGLGGPFQFARNTARIVPDFFAFHRHDANEPSADKAGWVLRNLRSSGLCPEPALLNASLGRRIFRPDIFTQANALRASAATNQTIETSNEPKVISC
jgi:ABC-type nitrate/sulfonate/bicarbonate transport system substrate-binding protein